MGTIASNHVDLVDVVLQAPFDDLVGIESSSISVSPYGERVPRGTENGATDVMNVLHALFGEINHVRGVLQGLGEASVAFHDAVDVVDTVVIKSNLNGRRLMRYTRRK